MLKGAVQALPAVLISQASPLPCSPAGTCELEAGEAAGQRSFWGSLSLL